MHAICSHIVSGCVHCHRLLGCGLCMTVFMGIEQISYVAELIYIAIRSIRLIDRSAPIEFCPAADAEAFLNFRETRKWKSALSARRVYIIYIYIYLARIGAIKGDCVMNQLFMKTFLTKNSIEKQNYELVVRQLNVQFPQNIFEWQTLGRYRTFIPLFRSKVPSIYPMHAAFQIKGTNHFFMMASPLNFSPAVRICFLLHVFPLYASSGHVAKQPMPNQVE